VHRDRLLGIAFGRRGDQHAQLGGASRASTIIGRSGVTESTPTT
jgi:hypothetical protein